MKKLSILLFFVFLAGITNFTYADYPIVGYSYLADPGAMWYNGRLYVYCSNDNENPIGGASYKMSSIVCVSSSDLKNWTDHGIVFNVPEQTSWTSLSWAPSPVVKNGKVYLYYGNGGSAIAVAVADNPLGPFTDPLKKALANGSTPGVQPFDGWLFDPMTFVDDDGKAYMYFGGNGDNNMRVATLNDDMISINGSVGKITVTNLFEAAWMHKYNGKYYLSYSTNPSNGMRIDYMISSNPTTGFTYGGVISDQPPINNNNNHQAIVNINGQWYQVYHNRIVARDNLGTAEMPYHRNLAIDAFSHNTNGTINKMVNTVDGVKQLKYLDPYIRQEGETMSDQKGINTEVCSAGGMDLAFIDNGDWTMVEGVDFGTAGANSFSARVASSKTGGTIEVRLGSTTGTLAGTVTVPNTGGLQTWQTVTISTTKISGVQKVYFVFKGSSTSLFNLDYWKFASAGPVVSLTAPTATSSFTAPASVTISATATVTTGTISKVEFFNGTTKLGEAATSPYSYTWTNVAAGTYIITAKATDNTGATSSSEAVTIKVNIPQGPYGGTPHAIPGKIELEHFDVGGNGVAYLDSTLGSQVDPRPDFRTDEDVDLETCTDVGTGYNLGWTNAGEWLEYTANVATAGKYTLTFRAACNGADRTVSLATNGTTIANNIAIPNTTGWQIWQDVKTEVTLAAGIQVLRLTIGATNYVNLNYMSFAPSSVPPTVKITSPVTGSQFNTLQTIPFTATASSTTGTIANVKFYSGTTLLSTDETAPYSFDWKGMAVGEYEITATATDNAGITSSDKVTITVSAAPITIPLSWLELNRLPYRRKYRYCKSLIKYLG
ncbi:MAG: carbohydrate-binding protein [Bacteroidales bacterium]|nr:carbohydrate-binding protein [Bacteroidales bacterium]